MIPRAHHRPLPSHARRSLVLAVCASTLLFTATASAVEPGAYAPDQILVRYAATPPRARAATARLSRAGEPVSASATARAAATATAIATGAATSTATGASNPDPSGAHTQLLRLPAGANITAALSHLRHRSDVLWAVPDYRAHTSGVFIPNDPGLTHTPTGWEASQWNFDGPFGVNAPEAWSNVAADGAPGGRGVVVAVLDTGVAYANRGRFRRSPDFSRFEFVRGYDFVAHNPYPNDHNGHGTFVASTIAESTNNRLGLTGLAYGVRLMPVRVLNSQGEGDASTIAEGVRFAVSHGAQVINLSLEFSSEVTASDIPELIEALRYARRRGVVVVAAAGNEGHTAIAYPARAPDVVAVGATTEHGCLANYSNDGTGLTLVAPGGGADADLPDDPNCHPELPSGRDVFQMTFTGSSPQRFGFPSGYEGTSMASPHVAATAALVIASGVLGRHPSPAQVIARLRATARPLGGPGDSRLYGAGLVNAGAATAHGGPGAVG
jgi:serine protease